MAARNATRKTEMDGFSIREQKHVVAIAQTGLLHKLQNFVLNAKHNVAELAGEPAPGIHRYLMRTNTIYRLLYNKGVNFTLFLDSGVDSEDVDELFDAR